MSPWKHVAFCTNSGGSLGSRARLLHTSSTYMQVPSRSAHLHACEELHGSCHPQPSFFFFLNAHAFCSFVQYCASASKAVLLALLLLGASGGAPLEPSFYTRSVRQRTEAAIKFPAAVFLLAAVRKKQQDSGGGQGRRAIDACSWCTGTHRHCKLRRGAPEPLKRPHFACWCIAPRDALTQN